MDEKYRRLAAVLRARKRVLVAFSGGTDSTLLLAVARRELGRANVLAVTAVSETYPARERARARSLVSRLGVRARFLRTAELANPAFARNPLDRCFHCKNELFGALAAIARDGRMTVCDGTTLSDRSDYRPGRRAARRWKVFSPLAKAGLDKDDVRRLSRALRLPTWRLPAQACLASRFPFGVPLTRPALSRVERTEELLADRGFPLVRARSHGDLLRIEVAPERVGALARLLAGPRFLSAVKALGWRFVTLDPAGYRMGSFNPTPRP